MRARLTVTEVVKLGPANVAKRCKNRHVNLNLEGVNRALGEIRETQHHLSVAFKKKYLGEDQFRDLSIRYDECGKMLRGLEQSLMKFKP